MRVPRRDPFWNDVRVGRFFVRFGLLAVALNLLFWGGLALILKVLFF